MKSLFFHLNRIIVAKNRKSLDLTIYIEKLRIRRYKSYEDFHAMRI